MNLRSLGVRKRNLGYDCSLKNPLYLQMNCAVLEVKEYFTKQSQAGLVIFDFGCGDKPYQDSFKNNAYIGIDIDKNNKKADIFSSVDQVPVKNNVADIVCSFFVLEHVYAPLSVLAEKLGF